MSVEAEKTRARVTLGSQLKLVEHLYGTDVLLALVFGLTLTTATIWIGARPIAASDLLLIPVLFLMLMSPDRGRLPSSYTVVTLLYLLWSVLSIGWSMDPGSTVGVLQYIEFFFLVPLAYIRVRNLRGLVAILDFYVFLASALSVAVILFAVSTGTFSYVYFLEYQKNHLGAVVANAIPLIIALMILSPGARKRYWVALVLTTLALLVSSSRGSMLGLIVGLALFMLLIRRIRFGVVAVVVGALFIFVYVTWIDRSALDSLIDFGDGTSAGSRWLIYDHALRFISLSPYVGQGVGSYEIHLPAIGFRQSDPSNVFLLNLAEVGVVGLILFVALLLIVFAYAVGNARRFESNWTLTVLSAALAAAFFSHIGHAQIDVSWIRGIGVFVFACAAMMMKLRQFQNGDYETLDGADAHERRSRSRHRVR